MKKVNKETDIDGQVYLQLVGEVYRSFDFFNKFFCEGKLPRPILMVGRGVDKPGDKQKAHGWFSGDSWRIQQVKEVCEITLCGESFCRGVEDVMGTLLHEMTHLKNYYDNDRKVVDCTEQQRHNQKFKTTAEFFGLTVTSSKRFGPAHTECSDRAYNAIELLNPDRKLFDLYRNLKLKEEKKKAKKSKLKPVMIGEETKKTIEDGSKKLGISQKEFVEAAANMLVNLADRAKIAAITIHSKAKTKLPVEDIAAIIEEAMKQKVETTTKPE